MEACRRRIFADSLGVLHVPLPQKQHRVAVFRAKVHEWWSQSLKEEEEEEKEEDGAELPGERQATHRKAMAELCNVMPMLGPRFVCDSTTMGLARQLRLCGIDAEAVLNVHGEAAWRQVVGMAMRDARVVLTTNRSFASKGFDVPLLHVRASGALGNTADQAKDRFLRWAADIHRTCIAGKQEQLREVVELCGIKIEEEHLMSRCVTCNGEFVILGEPLSTHAWLWQDVCVYRPSVKLIRSCWAPSVEPAEAQKCDSEAFARDPLRTYYQCSSCKQLYWQGYQFARAMDSRKEILKTLEDLHM
eukprot:scaffold723_cov363-Prasinococcus_capsulatus_cf.AAC.5